MDRPLILASSGQFDLLFQKFSFLSFSNNVLFWRCHLFPLFSKELGNKCN